PVETGYVIADESRGAEAAIQDFHLNLAAVGVASKGKLDAEFGGAIERIRVVGKKNIGHVTLYQRFDSGQHLLALSAAVVFALVIHADQIELRALKGNLRVRLTEQLHSRLGIEISRDVFRVSIDFVVAVTAPGTEWRVQVTNLVHAIGDRIARAGDEIASDNGEIGAKVVGHVDGTANLRAR